MNYSKEEVVDLLNKAEWKFAKTFAHKAPHWYSLLEKWEDKNSFFNLTDSIQSLGNIEWFWGRKFIVFEHEGWKYWNMDGETKDRYLINKSYSHTQYNDIAEIYDSLFVDEDFELENQEIKDMIAPIIKDKYVYDIGCGTGLFLDLFKDFETERYLGFDPSNKMVYKAREKYEDYRFRIERFETYKTFHHKENPTVAVSLFGSMNYVLPMYLEKIKQYGSNMFLMFYNDSYEPVTYKMTNSKKYPFKYTPEQLESMLEAVGIDATIERFNNYIIVKK